MEIMEDTRQRYLLQCPHGPKVDHHQVLPSLHFGVEKHLSTGMTCEGQQVKLDSDPISRCDKPHFKATLKQVNGAMLNAPPFILCSFRYTREHAW